MADKPVLRLVRHYLEAGAMAGGVANQRSQGTPQGGPLSPLPAIEGQKAEERVLQGLRRSGWR